MMNCETLRDRLAANPTAREPDFERHAQDCAACRAFLGRLLRTEALIERALRIELPPAAGRSMQASPLLRVRQGSGMNRWISLGAGFAAALVAALTLWSYAGGDLRTPTGELADAVIAHWEHEPDSLRPGEAAVSLADLTEVLLGTAEMHMSTPATVSYAAICRVGGRFMPHLVVQGETGPYMVLLMPGEPLASAVTLQSPDRSLAGRIFPSGSGSIAVLGDAAGDLAAMESLVAAAVDWSERP